MGGEEGGGGIQLLEGSLLKIVRFVIYNRMLRHSPSYSAACV